LFDELLKLSEDDLGSPIRAKRYSRSYWEYIEQGIELIYGQ